MKLITDITNIRSSHLKYHGCLVARMLTKGRTKEDAEKEDMTRLAFAGWPRGKSVGSHIPCSATRADWGMKDKKDASRGAKEETRADAGVTKCLEDRPRRDEG